MLKLATTCGSFNALPYKIVVAAALMLQMGQ
jgi:hypothetical protein